MKFPVKRRRAVGAWSCSAVALCVSVGCLLWWSAPALAASPPVVAEESVTNVAGSSATLEAQINPEGSETRYRFEYGTSEAYGASAPSPDGSAGAGASALTVQAHAQGLQAHTTYHYRLVAANAEGTVDGADHTFTTQTSGGALALPDGRQWELVSPPVKDGVRIIPQAEGGESIQAAADGGAFTYLATNPIEESPAGNANETQILSSRGAGTWSSLDIEPPHAEAIDASVGEGQEYKLFSSDLSLGIVQPFTGRYHGQALLSPEATEYSVYLHDNAAGGGGGYLPLVTAANVPPGTKFEGENRFSRVGFVAATPDLSHVLLTAAAALTPTPAEHGLYEWAAGHLRLVNILPNGEVAPSPLLGSGAGGETLNARGAISDDGSRVIWEGAGGLYLRDVAKGETVQLDAVQGGSGTAGGGGFQLATGDGSKVFFSDGQRLTADSTAEAGAGDIYECEIIEEAGKLACKLTDLTVDEHAGESAGVFGLVLGASENGSYVYFTAQGILAAGAAPSPCGATCNLYVRHDGRTTFIAALSPEDMRWLFSGIKALTARVSPNGRYLAFMSERSLTGYDNRDASSGAADEEVYLYDAVSNRLVCASCNPTGARPVGLQINQEHRPLAAYENIWGPGRWLAANVPAWSTITLDAARYQSRYLSNSGRLFFNSSDALVAHDTNGTEDVYEYEPAGVAGCAPSSVTFSETSGGCVGLISSGASGEESVFMDASTDGDDVFFMTTAQLSVQDFDNAYDVYDAHVCSAAVPCQALTALPPACTTADSCRAAPSLQPAVFGAPASATFSGAGNPAGPIAGPVVKRKGKGKPNGRGKHRHKQQRKRGKRGKAGKSSATRSLSARTRR